MKKIIAFSFLVVAVTALNVGCSASAGIHPSGATKADTTVQAAYVTSPAK